MMNINISKVKIIVTVPIGKAEKIKQVLGDAGADVIGNYTHCTISTKVIGTFKPNKNANPYIGKKNKLEVVQEEKIEVQCDIGIVKDVLKRLREVHPYEEPAIDIVPLINEKDL
ncbi:MAG: hypothetical protein ACOXZS_01960 [Bacilli bacterium]|jgi:hypothetical protein